MSQTTPTEPVIASDPSWAQRLISATDTIGSTAKAMPNIRLGKLSGSAQALALEQLIAQPGCYLLLAEHQSQALQLKAELEFFAGPKPACPIYFFPDWETLAYDPISPHPDLVSARIDLLNKLPQLKHALIITTIATSMQRLQPGGFFRHSATSLQVGQSYPLQQLRHDLEAAGYNLVDQVFEHGQYSVRGAIVDFFASGSEQPLRLELFDDEIESLRYFDPETQRSSGSIESTGLLAAREYPLDESHINRFRKAWRETFHGQAHLVPIYQKISDGIAISGAEYYLPLFFETMSTLFDYLPTTAQLIFVAQAPTLDTIQISNNQTDSSQTTNNQTDSSQTTNNQAANNELSNCIDELMPESIAKQYWQSLEQRYEQLSGDRQRPICPLNMLYLSSTEWQKCLTAFAQISLDPQIITETDATEQIINFATMPAPRLKLNLRQAQPLQALLELTQQQPQGLAILCQTAGREATMIDLLRAAGQATQACADWPALQRVLQPAPSQSTSAGPIIYTCCADINRGMWLTEPAILLLTEQELFANFVPQARRRKSQHRDFQQVIANLQQLEIGAPVVHREHGVGRYRGLEIMTSDEINGEFMVLEYAEGSKVYVPIQALDQISRYIGADAEHAPLHHLGRKQWQRAKEKTAARIRDVAAELLVIYSKRQAARGHAFKKPDANYHAFCAAFPFEETADQAAAIEHVIQDMCKAQCMDRLVCGDVGFGKTEVAMRAAFLAVMGEKQVAILVPTTLLAQQHLQTLQDRFASWPVKIAGLTRLIGKKQQNSLLDGMAEGKIDIVVATHKLLGEQIKFKNLGLLIVDEEHRFGVKQKDRLKKLRASVDILTLTATPIPRTLNLALTGTRDLSIIATPPTTRNAIQTFVREYQPNIIKEALQRELQRGGQAYYLHNKVSSIAATCEKIQAMLPQARVRYAHGQMREGELEAVMRDFYQQQFDVLVATTIIESGIDIPSANTIIIERADRFGLAELHQIRGRVGRSHHQAYAYLLTPPEQALASDAKKRLQAIMQLQELGSGFNLASEDLEIRGAGELLGENQSGQMHAIGFTLYMEMLDATVKALQSGKNPDEQAELNDCTLIDLPLACLLPETYIHDVCLRLDTYKRLASCSSTHELTELKAELIDRFGHFPIPAEQLWQSHRLRLQANALGVSKISGSHQFIYYSFAKQNTLDHQQLMQLLQEKEQRFSLQGANKLRQRLALPSLNKPDEVQDYFQTIMQTLDSLNTTNPVH